MTTTTTLDLSTAVLLDTWGQYRDGRIVTLDGFPDFFFPGFVFETNHYYLIAATYDLTDPANDGNFHTLNAIGLALPDDPAADYEANTYDWTAADHEQGFTTSDGVYKVVVGPGIWGWDDAIADGRTAPIFESDRYGALAQLQVTDLGLAGVPPTYSIGGVTAPAGAWQAFQATNVTANSVSAARQLSTVDDGIGTDPHLWFKLTATATAKILIDADLSYLDSPGWGPSFADGVDLYTGPSSISSSAELTLVDVNVGAGVIDLTEGSTYYLRVHQNSSSPPIDYGILRVSDYGPNTDWTQGTDQVWVVNNYGENGLAHPAQDPPTAEIGVGYGPQHMATYTGSYSLWASLGGPAPSDDGPPDVLWRNAKVGQCGFNWWSPDPLNPDVDIHAAWNGGPGTPVYQDDGRALPGRGSELDDFVGVVWSVDKSFPPATAGYTTWGQCWRFNVTSITRDFITGPGGGALDPTDFPDVPGGFTGNLVWENTVSELVGLQAAPDDTTGTENINGHCIVFAKVVPTLDGDGWGPNAYAMADETDLHADDWAGGLDKPDTFPGKQDVAFNVWSGGTAPWQDITTLIEPALEQEALDEPAFPFSDRGTYPGSLRFVSIPECLVTGVSDPVPDPDVSLVAGRNRQAMALQITLRPSRYRWVGQPSQPDVELTLDTGEITGALSPVRVRFYG